MKVRIAVTPPNHALDGLEFVAYLEACEQLGFDTVWLSDIPLGPGGDPLVSLSFAAAATQRLKLGANIVPLGRNPLWLAKQLAQLDQLSGGRLLLSFVPGLGSPPERAALGHAQVMRDRGRAVDQTIELLRRWWAGETVTASMYGFDFNNITVEPRPLQQPLEKWMGGKGTKALARVGGIADGWLRSVMTPAEDAQGGRGTEAEAAAHQRCVDSDHFGISVPFTRTTADSNNYAALQQRRDDGDLSEVVAVGSTALSDLIRAHIDAGLSKFVLRSIEPDDADHGRTMSWRDQLGWLVDNVLALQT